MLVRVVKMIFREDAVETFKALFESRKELIRNFEGCNHLELWQDKSRANIFFTYSLWQSEEALDAYRQSHFFDDTWLQTKKLFAGKPEAWSVHQLAVMQ
jgi:quinol monooxygenase YgiN